MKALQRLSSLGSDDLLDLARKTLDSWTIRAAVSRAVSTTPLATVLAVKNLVTADEADMFTTMHSIKIF